VNLINNTLYYFGDDDVYIGDISDDISGIKFIADNNIEKPDYPGITIFTK